jgi:hypothetical protein
MRIPENPTISFVSAATVISALRCALQHSGMVRLRRRVKFNRHAKSLCEHMMSLRRI